VANTTCPHCQNASFELREGDVGAKQQVFLVQCAKCGAPFAMRDHYDHGALLLEQDTRIKNIEQQIQSIATHIAHIGRIVGSIANQRTI